MADDPVGKPAEKICVKCGKDVRGLARTKDPKGRYWCKPCYDEAVARKHAKEAAEREAAAGGDDLGVEIGQQIMAMALEEGSAAAPAEAVACHNCGTRLPAGTVVCMSCGYNAQTGQQLSTTARDRTAGDKAVGAIADAAVTSAVGGSIVLTSILGAVIGGAIGAGIWAVIAIKLSFEIGWIATIVGALCGVGAHVGARGREGVLSGGLAVVVAITAILIGKYIFVSSILNELGDELAASGPETVAIEMLAAEVAEERWGDLETISEDQWELAFADAETKWPQLEPGEKQIRLAGAEDALAEWGESPGDLEEMKRDVVTGSLDFIDVVFFILAVLAAYGIGSGGEVGGDD